MANSHATKKPLRITSAAMAASLPTKTIGGSQYGAIASATGVTTKNRNNEKLIARMPPLHPRPEVGEFYQLALVTPGISPCEASSRKVSREILNRRMKARRRPVTSQRLTTRVGLALRGNCARPA